LLTTKNVGGKNINGKEIKKKGQVIAPPY